jgi:hypothetical protein
MLILFFIGYLRVAAICWYAVRWLWDSYFLVLYILTIGGLWYGEKHLQGTNKKIVRLARLILNIILIFLICNFLLVEIIAKSGITRNFD